MGRQSNPGYSNHSAFWDSWVMPAMNVIPTLEDELGDVLEKAIRHRGISEESLAATTGIPVSRIKDAEDYHYDLTCAELTRIARALDLNEVGLCAVGENKYPLPTNLPAVPFCVRPLPMPFGVGFVNAYLVSASPGDPPVLFDTGPCFDSLRDAWPEETGSIEAVFLTHGDRDHVGGLEGVRENFSPARGVYGPGLRTGGVVPLEEGEAIEVGDLWISVFSTPGHCAAHNSYLLRRLGAPGGNGMLVVGDLIFAGSLGAAFHCCEELRRQARRILRALPGDTLIAPGHGPFTTVETERRFNPFIT